MQRRIVAAACGLLLMAGLAASTSTASASVARPDKEIPDCSVAWLINEAIAGKPGDSCNLAGIKVTFGTVTIDIAPVPGAPAYSTVAVASKFTGRVTAINYNSSHSNTCTLPDGRVQPVGAWALTARAGTPCMLNISDGAAKGQASELTMAVKSSGVPKNATVTVVFRKYLDSTSPA